MKGSTTLLLLLSISTLFSLEIAGVSGNNVFFFDDSNIYVASTTTGKIVRSLSLPTVDGDVAGTSAYFATPSSLVVYRATSALTPIETLSLTGSIEGIDAKGETLYVFTYDETNSTSLLYAFSVDTTPSKVEFQLLNSTSFDETIMEVFDTPSRKAYFKTASGLYSYDGKKVVKWSSLPVKTPPVETPKGVLIGSATGVLTLYSFNALPKNSVAFNGAVDAIFVDGNIIRVATSDGKIHSLDINSFQVVSDEQGKDQVALASSSSEGIHALAYPSAVVRVKDRFRDRIPIEGALDVEVSGSTIIALAEQGGVPKVVPINSKRGCYLNEIPEVIGYVPINVSGYIWPPTSEQFGIRAGTETITLSSSGDGSFSLLLDPVGLSFGEVKISCIVGGIERDYEVVVRDEAQPKNTFVVSPLPQKVKKGETVTFTVRDAVGRELRSISLEVDGQKRTVDSPFSLTFNEEKQYVVTLSKEGFEPLTFVVEVPSFPILAVALVALLILAGIVYFIFSNI